MQKELAAKPLFPPAPAPKPEPTVTPAPKPQQAAPAPTTKPQATATAMPLPAGYYVQVGSFKDKQRAIALAGKVEDQHWQSRIAARPGGLHAVWVGPYPTRDAAEQAKPGLKKDTGLSGFVVQSP
ncbi:MAG TPA: SPOR domain-containing protein, partial [Mariprofundaceae bacterium]|nr:SPOR domain-containing protein [Mariprofundaceae bacterium]